MKFRLVFISGMFSSIFKEIKMIFLFHFMDVHFYYMLFCYYVIQFLNVILFCFFNSGLFSFKVLFCFVFYFRNVQLVPNLFPPSKPDPVCQG